MTEKERVKKYQANLNEFKDPEPDELHPQVLKKMTEVTACQLSAAGQVNNTTRNSGTVIDLNRIEGLAAFSLPPTYAEKNKVRAIL